MPVDVRVLADGIDRPLHRGEAKGLAGILLWDKTDAVALLAKVDLELGAVASFMQKKVPEVIDPVNRNVHDFVADFHGDAALLDLRGTASSTAGTSGAKTAPAVSGAETGDPAELLFMVLGKDGQPDRLMVLNAASDKTTVDAWEATHKQPALPDVGQGGPAAFGPSGGLVPGGLVPGSRNMVPGGLIPSNPRSNTRNSSGQRNGSSTRRGR